MADHFSFLELVSVCLSHNRIRVNSIRNESSRIDSNEAASLLLRILNQSRLGLAELHSISVSIAQDGC